MITINKPSSDNLGGITGMWAVPLASVTSLWNGVLTLTSSTSVISIYFTPGTAEYVPENVPASESKPGSYYRHKITAFVPRLDSSSEEILAGMIDRKYLVVLRDGNEQYVAVGNMVNLIRFSYTVSTGSDTNERAGYSILFEGSSKSPYMIISNPF